MKTPMELLKDIAPEFAANQMDERALLFENEKYQCIPDKYKLLIGIAAAAICGSDTCTIMWTKMAKFQGITDAGITEAMMIARYMKQATVNDAIAGTLDFLSAQK